MGRVFWVTSAIAAFVVVYALNHKAEQAQPVAATQISRADLIVDQALPDIGRAERLPSVGQNGFALATAAFGMSALQPETYNGDMVASIIAASPLKEVEKVQLTSDLLAAERGAADLQIVLSDVRSALAVD